MSQLLAVPSTFLVLNEPDNMETVCPDGPVATMWQAASVVSGPLSQRGGAPRDPALAALAEQGLCE